MEDILTFTTPEHRWLLTDNNIISGILFWKIF